jgi:hypothetical protein
VKNVGETYSQIVIDRYVWLGLHSLMALAMTIWVIGGIVISRRMKTPEGRMAWLLLAASSLVMATVTVLAALGVLRGYPYLVSLLPASGWVMYSLRGLKNRR